MALVLVVITSGQAWADAAPWTLDTELGLGYDSNVSNSEHSNDIHSAGLAVAGVRAEHRIPLGERDSLLLRGSLQAEAYDHFDGLDNGKLTGLLRYICRTGDAASAPLISVWGSAALWEFNSGLRDSAEFRAGVFLTQQINTALSARLGLAAARREADNPVFDLDGSSVNVDLDWTATPMLTVYGGTQFRKGDVVSTSTRSPVIRNAADVRTPDDVFDGKVAYRLDADTWIHTLGFNYGLSPTVSLDAQVQYIGADAAGGNNYERWISIASLLARF